MPEQQPEARLEAAPESSDRMTSPDAPEQADSPQYTTVEQLVRDQLAKALGGKRGVIEGAVPTLVTPYRIGLIHHVSLVICWACGEGPCRDHVYMPSRL